MTFHLWDVRSALVDTFTAAVASDVIVIDGPRSSGSTPKQFVVVGAVGDDVLGVEPGDGAAASHEWSTMGPGERQELGEVQSTIVAWSGATDLEVLRDQVQAIADACEAAVVADPSLGGVLDDMHEADVTGLRVSEAQTTDGAVVAAVLTVSYGAAVSR